MSGTSGRLASLDESLDLALEVPLGRTSVKKMTGALTKKTYAAPDVVEAAGRDIVGADPNLQASKVD